MKIICNVCYAEQLTIHEYDGVIYADPCPCACALTYEEGYEEGYENGYDVGYEHADGRE